MEETQAPVEATASAPESQPVEAAPEVPTESVEAAPEEATPVEAAPEPVPEEPPVTAESFGWDDWDRNVEAFPEEVRPWAERLTQLYGNDASVAAKKLEDAISERDAYFNMVLDPQNAEDPRLAQLNEQLNTLKAEFEQTTSDLQRYKAQEEIDQKEEVYRENEYLDMIKHAYSAKWPNDAEAEGVFIDEILNEAETYDLTPSQAALLMVSDGWGQPEVQKVVRQILKASKTDDFNFQQSRERVNSALEVMKSMAQKAEATKARQETVARKKAAEIVSKPRATPPAKKVESQQRQEYNPFAGARGGRAKYEQALRIANRAIKKGGRKR